MITLNDIHGGINVEINNLPPYFMQKIPFSSKTPSFTFESLSSLLSKGYEDVQ